MNSTDQEEFTISLKSLFLYPIYHWKSMLAIALSMILLGCFLIGLLTLKKTSKPGASADTRFTEYLAKKNDLESQLDFLEATTEGQQHYLDHSIRIKIDPYKTWHARYSVYVDADYKIMPEMTYQNPDRAPVISKALVDLLMSSQLREKIAASQNMDMLQLDELYWVYPGEGNVISIDVIADTESRTNAIMEMLKEELYSGEMQLSKGFGDFSIKETLNSIYEEVNINILNDKNELLSAMRDNHKEIIELRNEIKNLSEPDSDISKVVKRVILILFVSVIIPYGIFCVRFILNDRLYLSKDLVNRYGIHVLGVTPIKEKYSKLEKWARRMEDRVQLSKDESYALAASNVRNYCQGKKNLLVAGDMPAELCKSVTDQLQQNLSDIKLEYCGSFLNCAKSAAALGTCEGVVLIEQCGVSKISHIRQEIKQITDLEKPLIGCIVVDL